MKTLYPIQQQAHDHFLGIQKAGHSTLDTSETGSGKTVTACRLARSLGRPFGIVCPKVCVVQWERACEDEGIEPLFILSYEKLGTGNTEWMKKTIKVSPKGKRRRFFKWNLPPDTVLFWDEVHRCADGFTGNSLIHIKATKTGHQSHNMSATAAEDPTELRTVGYALGLHSLDESGAGKKSWFSWLRFMGCSQDPWKRWAVTEKTRGKMIGLREWLYQNRAFKVKRSDMPEAFRDNQIIVEPIDCGDPYEREGFTPEILLGYIETGEVGEMDDPFIVALLRARQLAEAQKVPALIEMIRNLLAEGYSVPVFVCFRDTLQALQSEFGSDMGLVQGGMDSDERQRHIDEFNSGTSRLIGVNVAAGGTGLSLHDTTGDRPRFVLISPSFSAKQMVQAMGRTNRAGMKSDTVQKVVLAADTVEEDVWKAVSRKMKNLETMLG